MDPREIKSLLDLIDECRLKRGMTRKELGKRAHVHEVTIAQLYRGARRLTLSTARRLGLPLGLEFRVVVGRKKISHNAIDKA